MSLIKELEIFCNDIIEDYDYHSDKSDNNLLNCGLDNQAVGWYECATAILKLIEDKRKIL